MFLLSLDAIIVFVRAIEVRIPSIIAIDRVYISWRPSITFPVTYDLRFFLPAFLFLRRHLCTWSMLCGSSSPMTEVLWHNCWVSGVVTRKSGWGALESSLRLTLFSSFHGSGNNFHRNIFCLLQDRRLLFLLKLWVYFMRRPDDSSFVLDAGMFA